MSAATKVSVSHAPFPGPSPFPPGGRYLFRGREREVQDVLDLLYTYRFLILYAQSGVGKSSLVNAGVFPALEAQGFSVVRTQVSARYANESRGCGNGFVANAIVNAGLSRRERTKASNTCTISEAISSTEVSPVLLVVDQLEEIFFPVTNGSALRVEFFRQLKSAFDTLSRGSVQELYVLLVIREDYYPRLDRYAGLLPYGCNIRYRLDRLDEDSARLAIAAPLRALGVSLTNHAMGVLIRSMLATNDSNGNYVAEDLIEPLELQIVCGQMWKRIEASGAVRLGEVVTISDSDVANFGNVDEAIRSFYDEAMKSASYGEPSTELRLRRWCETCLIASGGTRNVLLKGEYETLGIANRELDLLERQGLVRVEARESREWCELSHDRFVQAIQRSNAAYESSMVLEKMTVPWKRIVIPALVAGAAAALGLASVIVRESAEGRSKEGEASVRQVAEGVSSSTKKVTDAWQTMIDQLAEQRAVAVSDRESAEAETRRLREELERLNQAGELAENERSKLLQRIRVSVAYSEAIERSEKALSARMIQANSELDEERKKADVLNRQLDDTLAKLDLVKNDLSGQVDLLNGRVREMSASLQAEKVSLSACVASQAEALRNLTECTERMAKFQTDCAQIQVEEGVRP